MGAKLILLLLLWSMPAWATTIFVDTTRPDNSGACTSEATACRTIGNGNDGAALEKFNNLSGCGHSLLLHGNGQFHRITSSLHPIDNCPSTPQTIGCYNCATRKPVVTGSVLATGWTQFSGSGCTGATPNDCTWQWATAAGRNPGRMVFQNQDNPPVVQRNGDVVSVPSETDEPTAMHAKWAESTTSTTCPGSLTKRHHFCWKNDVLFLRSRGDPDTVYTAPGVEVVQTPGANGLTLLEIIDDSGYLVQDIEFRHASANLLHILADTTDVSRITLRRLKLLYSAWRDNATFGGDPWVGNSLGRAALGFTAEMTSGPGGTRRLITQCAIEDSEVGYSGRDGIHFSHSGDIRCDTRRTWIHHQFNHPSWYGLHEGETPNPAGARGTYTTDRLKFSDVCMAFAGNPAHGAGTIVHENFLVLSGVDRAGGKNADARQPIGQQCGNSEGHTMASGNPTIFMTFRRGLIVGNDTWERASSIQSAGVMTFENLTVHRPSIAGLTGAIGGTNPSGQAWTLHRSVFTDVPITGSVSAPLVLQAGTTAAGNRNAFRNRAATDQIGRIGGSLLSIQQWRDSAQTTGDANSISLHATPLANIYVNADAGNFNPRSGSPLMGQGGSTPNPATTACVGACEAGAFEIPVVSTGTVISPNTWQFPVQMLVPPVVIASTSCATPSVNGVARSGATLSVVNSTTVRVQVPGAAPGANDPLAVSFTQGCIRDSLNLGNDPRFTNHGHPQTVSVTNTIQIPTPADCSVAANDADGVTFRWDSGGSSPMKPAGPTECTNVQVDDNSSFSSPDTIDSCLRIGTTDSFLVDLATNRTPGQEVWVRVLAGSNIMNQANVAPVLPVTFPKCVNHLVAPGDTCYVDNGCSNNITTYNPTTRACTGGTARSYSTLNNAVTGGVCGVGATFIMRGGTYTGTQHIDNTIPAGVSANQRTTVRGQSGETVIIQSSSVDSASGAVLRIDRSHILIENIIIDGTSAADDTGGIRLTDNASDVVFSGITVRDVPDDSIKCDNPARGIQVLNSTFQTLRDDGPRCSTSPFCHHMYWSCQSGTISGNDFSDWTGFGIQVFTQGSSPIVGNVVRNNYFHDADAGAFLFGSDAEDTLFTNNVIDTVRNGMNYGGTNNEVYHNTVFNTSTFACIRRPVGGQGETDFPANEAALIKNNVFANCGGSQNQRTPSGNLCTGTVGGGCTSTTLSALAFANSTTGDFHLGTGSTARDAVACVADVTTDKDGTARPVGALCDYGAFEFDTPDSSPPLIISCDPAGLLEAGGLVLPAGTTSLTRSCTTNESATCKLDGQANEDFDDMSGPMTAVGNVHSLTHSGLADGATHIRYIRCEDSTGNENPANLSALVPPIAVPANGVRIQYSVALPSPTVSACVVENATPTVVRCRVNLAGSAPILPTNDCTGWTGSLTTSGGTAAWPVTDCDANADGDGIDLVMDRAMRFGNTATVTYTEGTGTPVTNQEGQELTGGTFAVGNQVVGVAPVLTACEVRDSAPTEIVWDFFAGAPGAMTGTNCTSLSATINAGAYTQTDCDPTGNMQFRTVHTPTVVFGDVIRGIVTQGTATPIVNADGVEVAPLPAPGLLCTNNVGAPPAAPMLSSLRVTGAEPNEVKVLLTTEAPPLLPAADCVGFSCTRNRQLGQGDQPWAVTDCALESLTTQVLTMEDELLFGDTYACTYTTQAGGEAGRVRDQNGTQLAAFSAVAGQNLLPQPTEPGTVTMVNIRCRAAEVPGSGFTQGATLRNASLNGLCELAAGATVQVFLEIQCDGDTPCSENGYHIQACDDGACDSGGNLDHDAAGWYAIPNADSAACTGKHACLGEDSTVSNQTPTSSCLSGATRDAGVYLKQGAAGVVPTFSMAPGRCAQYVAVITLQPSMGVDGTIDFRVATSDGQRLGTYPSGRPGRAQVTSTGVAQR